MSAFTKGPWRQGVTLFTRQTSKWNDEQLAENNRRESLMLFANFDWRDEGRSRNLIGKFERSEDARLCPAAPDMLAALKAVLSVADRATMEFDLARAAIAKAEGAK